MALLALLGSAAFANDDEARKSSEECTRAVAVELRKEPTRRDLETIRRCLTEMHVVGELVVKRDGHHASQRIQCAACGMRPTIDPETGIWRPYSR